jgi:hypothetical protein
LHWRVIKTQSSTRGRPNTQFPFGSLKPDAILCCGEDPGEFKNAISAIFGRPRAVHAYRCYALFEVREISFIWTGLGTGCIEPLLCEIHDETELRRILLVGTAGSVGNRTQLGLATPIRQATISCAGISPKTKRLFPNWRALPTNSTQTIVSTDYYYGFTLRKKFPTPKLWAADTRLCKSVSAALARADLVDMETGQFYHLCRVLRPDWQYLAIKGAANPLSDFSQQTLHSESVLHDALRQGKALLI